MTTAWLPAVPAPTASHRDICAEVVLASRSTAPKRYVVNIDLPLGIDEHDELRPNLVVVPRADQQGALAPIQHAILAADVISPGANVCNTIEKAKLYSGAGIPMYWVIDPAGNALSLTEFVLDPARGSYRLGRSTSDEYETGSPWPIRIDLPAISARWAPESGAE